MGATDLQLDPTTHDLVMEGGQLVLEPDPAEVLAQRVRVRLRLWLGEWYLDGALGADYKGKILVKSPQKAAVVAELRRVIESTPGVKRLVSLAVDYDPSAREFRVTRGVVEGDAGAVEIGG